GTRTPRAQQRGLAWQTPRRPHPCSPPRRRSAHPPNGGGDCPGQYYDFVVDLPFVLARAGLAAGAAFPADAAAAGPAFPARFVACWLTPLRSSWTSNGLRSAIFAPSSRSCGRRVSMSSVADTTMTGG